MKSLGIIVFAALCSAPLSAAGPEEEAAAAQAAKKMQDDEGGPNAYVCKKFPPPAGTRLGKRQICKTQAEWDQMEKDLHDGIRKMQRKPCDSGRGPGPCG